MCAQWAQRFRQWSVCLAYCHARVFVHCVHAGARAWLLGSACTCLPGTDTNHVRTCLCVCVCVCACVCVMHVCACLQVQPSLTMGCCCWRSQWQTASAMSAQHRLQQLLLLGTHTMTFNCCRRTCGAAWTVCTSTRL